MDKQFDEAPPLPREPTALNVPQAMGTASSEDPVTELPVDAHQLPPPPKFPSLTDVALPSATAASESLNNTTYPVSTQLSDEIAATLARDAVAPGTGAKKAMEAGQRLWTSTDQEELNKLLDNGKEVLIPPDVTADEIAHKRPGYVLVPSEPSVDDSPDKRSSSGRVSSWNHVQPADCADEDAARAIGIIPTPGSTVEDPQSRSVDDSFREGAHHHDPNENAGQKGYSDTANRSTGAMQGSTAPTRADVSTTIFGGQFLTIPVKSRKTANAPIPPEPQSDVTEVIETTTTDVELRTDTAASINVTDDYGLKGGHASGVNDAAFLNNDTLVTCGDDGKVCVWDMSDRTVDSEFVPYDGEGVIMVYPLPDEDNSSTKTIMTLSKGRMMRIWSVDERQAVMLRESQIKTSDKALYMSIPHISKEVKARAAAAAAAAAVTTTDAPQVPVQFSKTNEPATDSKATTEATVTGETETGAPVHEPTVDEEEEVEDEKKKRFSFTKVLSFGRSTSGKKAMAS